MLNAATENYVKEINDRLKVYKANRDKSSLCAHVVDPGIKIIENLLSHLKIYKDNAPIVASITGVIESCILTVLILNNSILTEEEKQEVLEPFMDQSAINEFLDTLLLILKHPKNIEN